MSLKKNKNATSEGELHASDGYLGLFLVNLFGFFWSGAWFFSLTHLWLLKVAGEIRIIETSIDTIKKYSEVNCLLLFLKVEKSIQKPKK